MLPQQARISSLSSTKIEGQSRKQTRGAMARNSHRSSATITKSASSPSWSFRCLARRQHLQRTCFSFQQSSVLVLTHLPYTDLCEAGEESRNPPAFWDPTYSSPSHIHPPEKASWDLTNRLVLSQTVSTTRKHWGSDGE